MSNPNQRGAALAKLHIAKKELHLAEDSYRTLLTRHGAPAQDPSARHMSLGQINSALNELIHKGWKPRRPQHRPTTNNRPASHHTPRQHTTKVDALRAVWIDMAQRGYLRDGSDQALLNWVRKQTTCIGKPIDAIDWLNQDDALITTLLHRLKSWRKRLQQLHTPHPTGAH